MNDRRQTIFSVLVGAMLCAAMSAAHAADPASRKANTPTLGAKDGSKPDGKLLTRDELRQCMALEASIKTQNADMTKGQEELVAEKAEIAREQQELKDAQPKIDATDSDAVKAFNEKLGDNEKRIDGYNVKVPAFNALGEKLHATQATWQTDCSGRPYNEVDFYAIQRGK